MYWQNVKHINLAFLVGWCSKHNYIELSRFDTDCKRLWATRLYSLSITLLTLYYVTEYVASFKGSQALL